MLEWQVGGEENKYGIQATDVSLLIALYTECAEIIL